MPDFALSTLVAAWRTSMIAITLFTGAVELARYWDASIFMKALFDALAAIPS